MKNAFDEVDWIKLMEILCNIGADWRDERQMEHSGYIFDLLFNSEIGRGVSQGY